MVGRCPQTVDDLSGVQSHTAVTGHKELRHTILAQHHDLLRQFDFQFSAAVIFFVKAPRKPHGILTDDGTAYRFVHRLTRFVVYQLIFNILSVAIFRVKENVSYKRINKTL